MFITVRKKVLVAMAAFIVIVVALACALPAVSVAVGASKNGLTVVIDAGHGGVDGGVVGGVSGVKESDVNLCIAKSLAHFLRKGGYEVVMTREGYDGLYERGEGSLKLSDMRARSEIINSARPDLVVSVHQNSYPQSGVKGAQVFYSEQSEKSKAYANYAQNALNDALGGTRQAKSARYYLLQCSPYPSILIECGFLSNPEEEALLIRSEYQEKVAYAIYTGICVSLMEKSRENSHEMA